MLPGKRTLAAACFLLFYLFATAQQSNPEPDRQKPNRLKTDIFILNTCDPSQISLSRKYDVTDPEFILKSNTRRMEISNRRLSSFKIEGINPLRYKYYINSEAVTQFMEVNLQTLQLNNFFKEGYFSTPDDIRIPEIFKKDIPRNNLRSSLQEFQPKIENAKDSISFYVEKVREVEELGPKVKLDTNYNIVPFTNAEQKLADETKQKIEPLVKLQRKFEEKLKRTLEEYEKTIMTLPISSSELSILRDYKTRAGAQFSTQKQVREIQMGIKAFAERYDTVNEDFREIDGLLFRYGYGREYGAEYETTIKQLSAALQKYGYAVNLNDRSFYNHATFVNTVIIGIREFMIKKRYQIFEDFVLGTATKIGIMLQSNFRQVSQFNNSLKSQNCLSKEQMAEVKKIRENLSEVFDFVQKTSAEFQILVSYLDIDNKIYADIANSINAHYFSLLVYLKNFDYIEPNNTIEFTLPSSTNLGNTDLIRYKIEREDKITGGKQTYVYDFWIKGGLKVDFSFGIFGSGLVDNEYNMHQYDISGTVTDSIEIKRSKSGRFNFGFGGMVNVTPRLGASWISPGVNFGIIYSSNQKLQFLSGLSLHLGKTERLILHGGAAFGFVETLDQSKNQMVEISKNNIYRVKANASEFNIPLVDRFTVRPFFGLSYNLSKKNALQAVSDPGLTRYNELQTGPAGGATTP